MRFLIIVLLHSSIVLAQFRQLSGSSGSISGSASSQTMESTVLAGQPIVGAASGGEFGARSGITSIFEQTIISLEIPDNNPELPSEFSFAQNFPNPFNPSTSFKFTLPVRSSTNLIVYDNLGREAARVFEQDLAAGTYTSNFVAPVSWASGVYFAVFKAGNFVQVRKLVLLK